MAVPFQLIRNPLYSELAKSLVASRLACKKSSQDGGLQALWTTMVAFTFLMKPAEPSTGSPKGRVVSRPVNRASVRGFAKIATSDCSVSLRKKENNSCAWRSITSGSGGRVDSFLNSPAYVSAARTIAEERTAGRSDGPAHTPARCNPSRPYTKYKGRPGSNPRKPISPLQAISMAMYASK